LSVNEEESEEDKKESLDRETREARETRPKDIGAPSPEDQPIPGQRSFKTACIATV
jgi:hypothetical protein